MKNNEKVLLSGLSVLEDYIKQGKIPGGQIAFVTKDEAGFNHAGYAQTVDEEVMVDENTLYDIASLTKVVSTTTMALTLIEKGYFSLKTPLKQLLPEFRFDNVLIQHVLSHTSGICFDDKAYKSLHGRKQILDFVCAKELEFEPGTKVVYSDFGFVLLGFAIENIVGRLDEYAKKVIFDPLKMNNTIYRPEDHNMKQRCAATEITSDRGLVKGEVHDGKAYRLDGLSGNAGLFSNSQDLSRFVRMLLNQGQLEENRILSKATINLFKKCYTEGLNSRRTLGWICNDSNTHMGDYYSDKCIFHTGFTGTSIYVDFVRECGIILLTNRVHPNRDNNSIMELRDKVHNVMLCEFDNR